jgi:hypothetical protein
MVDIDKMRIAAVRALEALGYTYRNDEWSPAAVTIAPVPLTAEADTLHTSEVAIAAASQGRHAISSDHSRSGKADLRRRLS